MVEEDEKLNKVKIEKKKNRKDVKDVLQKELCKCYFKASIII